MDSMDNTNKKPIKFIKRQDPEHPYCTNWPMSEEENAIESIFPCPIYHTQRNSDLESSEMKEIEDILEKGMRQTDPNHYVSNNTYIFNTKLYNIKEFCEKHIKNYVDKVISPKKELNFYITQSWLNMTEPGGMHGRHRHQNSIIGGVFYIITVENDCIFFNDSNQAIKENINFEVKEYNPWNSSACGFPVNDNKLILFPPWMEHSVPQNDKATTNRISLSFNVFAKGIFGREDAINELIL